MIRTCDCQTDQTTTKHFLIFSLCWCFIGLVSAIDTGLTVHFIDELGRLEENPIARFILEYDNWKPSRFVGLKVFGTILVLWILMLMHHSLKSKYVLAVVMAVASFQGGLLLYLIL